MEDSLLPLERGRAAGPPSPRGPLLGRCARRVQIRPPANRQPGRRGQPDEEHRRVGAACASASSRPPRGGVALLQVAGSAGGDDVLPDGVAAAVRGKRDRGSVARRSSRSRRSSTRPGRRALVSRSFAAPRAARGCTGRAGSHAAGRRSVSRGAAFRALRGSPLALEHEHMRAPNGTTIQRLVARVQDENLAQCAPKGSFYPSAMALSTACCSSARARSTCGRGRAASRTRARSRGPGSRSERSPSGPHRASPIDADWCPPVSS